MKKTIDVIIPAHNAHNKIEKTLYSLSYQTNADKLSVYIVNDGSKKDYSNEIKFFSKFLSIKELKLKTHKGTGCARQYGIDNSSSKYILFINAGDMLLTPIAIKRLEDTIKKTKANVVSSNIEIEDEKGQVEKHDNEVISLNGNLYEREFLNEKGIKFNNDRINNYIGFNMLVFLNNAKIESIEDYTYIGMYNSELEEYTNILEYYYDNIFSYISNIKYALKTAIKRKCSMDQIAYFANNTLISIYYYYLTFKDMIYKNKLLTESKELYNICEKYPISTEKKNEIWYSAFLLQLQNTDLQEKINPEIKFKDFLKLYEEL